MTVGRINGNDINLGFDECRDTVEDIRRHTDRRAYAQSPVIILARVRKLPPLLDILEGNQATEQAVVVDNRELFNLMLLQNLLGFLVALLLNQQLPGQGMLRALILLPWVLPGVVAAVLWRFMYDPQLGLINSFLMSVGLAETGIAWLGEPGLAMGSAIIAAVWKGFPFSTVVYLAALQNVDREQIEAATVDGAGPIARLFDVVLPAMREVVMINIILTTVFTFNYFDMIWVLTRGGPQNATHIFPTKIFELGFGQFRFGEAAVYGVFSILVLVLLVLALPILLGMWVGRRYPGLAARVEPPLRVVALLALMGEPKRRGRAVAAFSGRSRPPPTDWRYTARMLCASRPKPPACPRPSRANRTAPMIRVASLQDAGAS